MALVRAWLGLDDRTAAHAPRDLPTLREAAEAAACTKSQAQAVIGKGRGQVDEKPLDDGVCDEVADFIQRKEGIVTVGELAADAHRSVSAVIGRRSNPPAARSCCDSGGAGVGVYQGIRTLHSVSRFVHRTGHYHQQPGAAFATTSTDRAKYAEALSQVASQLAKEEPLPYLRPR